MRKEYQWKQKLFQSTTSIILNNKSIGGIKIDNWKGNISSNLNDHQILFKRKKWFNSFIEVIKNGNVIGTLKFSPWGNKVSFETSSIEYIYKPMNPWKSTWGLYLGDKKVNSTKGSFYNGTVRDYINNEELVLISISIRRYLNLHAYAG